MHIYKKGSDMTGHKGWGGIEKVKVTLARSHVRAHFYAGPATWLIFAVALLLRQSTGVGEIGGRERK